jgi:nucleotidyltransferase/DNA polymerase involved in DNA repair
VTPRFEVYKAVSQQIRQIFAEHTPIIEPLSLDEAYLDVTENLQGIPLARDVALAIRAKIKEVTGLNASAGISYNKFLAKLASDHRKPNGQFVITPEMGPAFVEALPVGKFHGIGPATSAKMNSLGLYTGLDMRNQTLEFMQANFGKAGAYYYWISRGVDDREVRANRIRKSVGAENTCARRRSLGSAARRPCRPRSAASRRSGLGIAAWPSPTASLIGHRTRGLRSLRPRRRHARGNRRRRPACREAPDCPAARRMRRRRPCRRG